MTGPFIKLYHGYLYITRGLPRTPRNLLTTVLFLCAACVISGELLRHTGGENNSDLVFIFTASPPRWWGRCASTTFSCSPSAPSP